MHVITYNGGDYCHLQLCEKVTHIFRHGNSLKFVITRALSYCILSYSKNRFAEMRVRLLLLEKVGLLQQDAVTQQSGLYDVEVVSFSKRLCNKRSPRFHNSY